jgi:uncharacterized protein YgiM (DUF1202 family)
MRRWLCVLLLLLPVGGAAWGAEPYRRGVLMGDDVYVRSGAGQNFRAMGQLKKGDEVKVLEASADDQWLRIEPPADGQVYIFAEYVRVEGQKGTVTNDRVWVRVRPELTGETVAQVNKGAGLKVLGRDGEWLRIAPPPGTAAWISSQFVKRMTAAQYAEYKQQQAEAKKQQAEAKRLAEAKQREEAERLARLKREAARKQHEAALAAKAEALLRAELAKPTAKRSLAPSLKAWQLVEQGVQDAALRTKARTVQHILRDLQACQEALARKADPPKLSPLDREAARNQLGLAREVDALLAAHQEATRVAQAAKIDRVAQPPAQPAGPAQQVFEGWLTHLGPGLSATGASGRLVVNRKVVALVKSDRVDFVPFIGMRVQLTGRVAGRAALPGGDSAAIVDVANLQVMLK